MKCTITLLVGGESILILVDSSRLPNSLSELKEILGQERWKTLVDKIDTTLKERKKINKPDLEEIKKSGHIIPNTTMGAIINRYPNISFPEDTDLYNISDIKVLFVLSYKTLKGELLYGLFTNKNGELIFIVDEYNLESVAKYLLTMKSLKSDHILRNIDPEIMKNELVPLLKECKNHISGLSSVEDMLINFLLNRSKYTNITFLIKDDIISAYAYLDELTGNLFKISHRRSYNDSTINNISHSLTWNKAFDTASIGIDLLFRFISTELKNKITSSVGEKTLTEDKFKELFSGKINDKQLNNIFGKSDEEPYKILIDYLTQLEPEFAMKFKEVKNNRIYLSKYFLTLESQYGIGFELLKEYNEPTYYNGKYIQQVIDKDGISTYFVTRHYTTHYLRAKKFDTLEEAYNYINNNPDEEIIKNSFIELHKKELDKDGNLITDDNNSLYFRTRNKYLKGQLLTLLDYDVPNVPLNLFNTTELMFISENYRTLDEKHKYATKLDFYDFVKTGLNFPEYSDGYNTIVENINTPEKIALFIIELNNPNVGNGKAFNKNSESAILKLARRIGNINKYKYYYVESSGDLYVRLLRVDNESKESYRKEPHKPVILLWNAASKVFSKKLGIDIKILTEPEEGKENAKAYIKGDKIYINIQKASSKDLFHEYVHILMSYLKNTPKYRDRYRELINNIWELGKDDLARLEIENNEFYKDYSIEDKMEEYFVDLFGRWIRNNSKEDFKNIFSSSSVLKEGSSIFSSTTPISELYGSTVSQVFTKLNSDVAQFFKDNLPLMSSEYKNLFKVSRLKSEWIRQQIKDGKLREYDCV